MIATLWRHRGFIWRNALSELRHRYAGSALGILWNVITPLIQIVIFSVIFSVLMQNKLPQGMIDNRFSFTIYLCAGLLPWTAFAEALSRGTGSIVAHSGYLKKLRVPEHVFIAQDVTTYFLSGLISLALFVAFCFVAGHWPAVSWLQLLLAHALFVLFAFGISMALSALNVFFRDTSQALSIVLLLWMWMTPVVYTPNLLDHIRPIRMLLVVNPAYPFVQLFHRIVIDDRTAWLPPQAFIAPLILTAAAILGGYWVLSRLRPEIRDAL
ncbi:MAG: Teichoic acid translocation permease protein TagG [Phycisphaerae bacterium]|nr:Teichoic acid translocation permease protein TagG [Phycisphaerae bacterium]